MKEIQIGDSKYELLESVNDINDKRFAIFKMYLLKTLEGVDKPLFKNTIERALEFFNRGKYMQAYAEFQNYHRAIEYDDYNDDAMSKCFALICLEPGEDQLNIDENFLYKKLEKMHQEGLTRGFVEESVNSFIIASPISFGSYSLMLEEVTQNLEGILSTELMPLQSESEQPKEKKS